MGVCKDECNLHPSKPLVQTAGLPAGLKTLGDPRDAPCLRALIDEKAKVRALCSFNYEQSSLCFHMRFTLYLLSCSNKEFCSLKQFKITGVMVPQKVKLLSFFFFFFKYIILYTPSSHNTTVSGRPVYWRMGVLKDSWKGASAHGGLGEFIQSFAKS